MNDFPNPAELSPETTPEPTICLDQFLKCCGVETGGQAKRLIQGGEVFVNEELETRRRRKLRAGDEVRLWDDVFIVAPNETPDESSSDETSGEAEK